MAPTLAFRCVPCALQGCRLRALLVLVMAANSGAAKANRCGVLHQRHGRQLLSLVCVTGG